MATVETNVKKMDNGKPVNGTNGGPTNGHKAVAPTRQFKADPPAGRKESFEEALDAAMRENKELMRRLA